MSEKHLFFNKFEIPLTVPNTEEVFDNIKNTDHSVYIDSRLIKDVYMPVHTEDGTSGRPFWYKYSKEAYYNLIKRILNYKPVVVTYPHGHVKVMEKYINLGVKDFMVSEWNEDCDRLKEKYKDLKFYRSIVKNSYNEDIDERFDGIVVPYKKLLDIEWIKEKSQKVELIAIINHFCKPNCENLDNHLSKELENYNNEKVNEFICPPGRNLFIPRQVVLKINPYITTFKLVDRLQHCFDYEKFIRYYTGEEMLNEGEMGKNLRSMQLFYEATIIHKLYEHSNLVTVNCEFKCNECDKKCY